MGSQPLRELALKPIPPDEHSTKVAEHWDKERGWKWEQFSEYLPPTTLQQIASFELAQDTESKDKIFWRGDPTGKFTIKSAIHTICQDQDVMGKDS